jgi:ribosome recycling factor
VAEQPEVEDLRRRMDGAIASLKTEFVGLRTGRASAGMLEPVTVDAYGSAMPLNQVGTISVPEPRMLVVQVWDRGMVGAVDKAIRNSGLGLNPITEGQVIRVPVPELSEQRRAELSKVAARYAEQARVAIRNVRRDGMEHLKKQEKDGDLGQDDHKRLSERVQKLTDEMIHKVDETLAAKEREIMQI